jgi:AraC-like DNA-binding protein
MLARNAGILKPNQPDRAGLSPASPDPISEVLAGLRIRGARFSKVLLSPPFGLALPAERFARFHFVAAGQAIVLLPNGKSTRMSCGDAVLIPRACDHKIVSDLNAPVWDVRSLPSQPLCRDVCAVDARSPTECRSKDTLIFTACMELELDSLHPLISLMPDIMPVAALQERQPDIRHLLHTMEREMAAARAGSAGILARLSEVVAANIVREWVEAGDGDAGGWIAALRDPRLGKVLVALHCDPGKDWTVAEMAKLMGSSRTVFAERFTSATGVPPLRYLARLRMHLASQWMSRDRLSVDQVARRLNYNSPAAFSRAFKRFTGRPPSQVRRSSDREEAAE